MVRYRVPLQPIRNDFVRHTSTNEAHSPPRHRVEKPKKYRHFLLTGSLAAASTAIAISVGVAAGGGAVGATAPHPVPHRDGHDHTPAPVSRPEAIVRSAVVDSNGAANGPVTGGTVVTVKGADLGRVASVSFGGNPGHVVSATTDTVTISTPPSTTGTGSVAVELFDIDGQAVSVAAPGANGAAAAAPADASPADASAAAAAIPAVAGNVPAASAGAAPLTFSYVPDPHVAAEIAYTLAHWDNYNSAYGRISGNDCVNFASQALTARGWAMDGQWSFDPKTTGYSPAWSSSTAFADYLAAHPERATALSDSQRLRVKVGDVVQFDWNRSGDRDHTGIVTRVDKSPSGVKIYYASHTISNDFKSVDESLANTGGSVSYWSIT